MVELLHDLLAGPVSSGPGAAPLVAVAREILLEHPFVFLDTTNEEVRIFFAKHPDLETVAVVDEHGRPSGLINRFIFAEAYAHPFAREVYGKRSCIAWMDKEPLVMDENTGIEALVKAALAKGPKVLKDGFLGTREERYVGQGSGFSLLKAMEAIESEETRQLMESITYASTIQRSHLNTSLQQLAGTLEDYSLHWAPRDVVGGDCYFFRNTPSGLFGAVVDCTGHGVPGAFMSLITLSFLSFLVGASEEGVEPGRVLSMLNQHIKVVLSQTRGAGLQGLLEDAAPPSDDGLDAACFLLAPDRSSLRYSGARMPLFLAGGLNGASRIVEAERMGIGYVGTPDDHRWQAQDVALPAGCRVMIPTDGITDQVGGPNGVSLGRKRLLEWFDGACAHPAGTIGKDFLAFLQNWQGDQVRRDDATFLVFTP